jgi:hypothetical protein
MSSLKVYLYRDFAAGVYLSEAQNTIHLPPYSLYTCIQYTYLQREGGRGKVKPEGRWEGQQFTKLDRKYQHDWMYLQSTNSDKHLPQSPFTGQIFVMTTFRFGVWAS